MPFLTSTLRLASGKTWWRVRSPPLRLLCGHGYPCIPASGCARPGSPSPPPQSGRIHLYGPLSWLCGFPSIRISFLPRCSGAYISPCFNTFMDSFPLQQNHYSTAVIYMCLLYYCMEKKVPVDGYRHFHKTQDISPDAAKLLPEPIWSATAHRPWAQSIYFYSGPHHIPCRCRPTH